MTTRTSRTAVYGLDDELRFGQHKGEQLWTVIRDDPRYVEWCMENVGLEIDNESYAYLQDVTRALR